MMKNITEKDFKKLRTKLNKLCSAWHDFKMNLEDQELWKITSMPLKRL